MTESGRDPLEDIDVEEDPRYPSGPWTGYYNYAFDAAAARYRQDLMLTFRAGRLTGEGLDSVGPFLIRGRYDKEEGRVWWTKTYPGSHDVSYSGYREGKGIWGTWAIGTAARGGFMIWPKGLGEEATLDAEADAEIEVRANAMAPLPREASRVS